jgi:hypothetical protein
MAILADLENHVDGYIAALSQGAMETAFAADIAARFIGAGRPAEAIHQGDSAEKIVSDETPESPKKYRVERSPISRFLAELTRCVTLLTFGYGQRAV